MRFSRAPLAAGVVVGLGFLAACSSEGDPTGLGTPEETPQPTTRTASPATMSPKGVERPRLVRTVATGLEVPWGVTFLPDGTALVGERDSTRVVAVEGRQVREVGRIDLA